MDLIFQDFPNSKEKQHGNRSTPLTESIRWLRCQRRGVGDRITSDLTQLNKYIIPEGLRLPMIRDIILNMAGSKIFSKLDLKKKYFQIPLHPDTRHISTTITPLGIRQYKRLPSWNDGFSINLPALSAGSTSMPGVSASVH